MKISNLLFAAVLAFVIAAPAAAVSIFADGFEDGTTCAWGPGCLVITPLDSSATTGVEGHSEWADYEIEFAVWAPRDVYIEKESGRSANPTIEKGFWFAIKSTNGVYESGITPFSMTAFCPCNDTPTHFKVAGNTSRTFRLNVRLDNNGAIAGFYKTQVTGLSYKFDGANGNAAVVVTALPADLETFYVFVDDENTNPLDGLNAYDDFHQTTSQ